MRDIERATKCVVEFGHSVAAVKDGILLGVADGPGVGPFVELANRLGDKLRGASLADRVIGKAVAMACGHLGVAEVYGLMTSEPAIAALDQAGVRHSAGKVVPFITGRNGTDLCPTERLVQSVDDPAQALPLLDRFVQERKAAGAPPAMMHAHSA